MHFLIFKLLKVYERVCTVLKITHINFKLNFLKRYYIALSFNKVRKSNILYIDYHSTKLFQDTKRVRVKAFSIFLSLYLEITSADSHYRLCLH